MISPALKRCSSGVMLVYGSWVLLTLSLLAMGLGYRLSLESRMNRFFTQDMELRLAAQGGIYRAIAILSRDKNDTDTLMQCGLDLSDPLYPEGFPQEQVLGDIRIETCYAFKDDKTLPGISDEQRKLNLNTATQSMLALLFQRLGEVEDDRHCQELAAAVMDWRDEDHAGSISGGFEDATYASLDKPYECADRPLRSLEELLLIHGFSRELYQKIQPYVTVYGETPISRLNLNTVSSELLAVIHEAFGMNRESAVKFSKEIEKYRSGPDGVAATADDRVLTAADITSLEVVWPNLQWFLPRGMIAEYKNFFQSFSTHYRIEVIAKLEGRPTMKKLTALVKKGTQVPPFLAYREE